MAVSEREKLVQRIARWREDDTAGYDQAIELLCDAEYALKAADQQIKALQHEPDSDDVAIWGS